MSQTRGIHDGESSLIVSHIQKLKCAVLWGRVLRCRAGGIWSLCYIGARIGNEGS